MRDSLDCQLQVLHKMQSKESQEKEYAMNVLPPGVCLTSQPLYNIIQTLFGNYCIVGNFEGENFRRSVGGEHFAELILNRLLACLKFCGENFHGWL